MEKQYKEEKQYKDWKSIVFQGYQIPRLLNVLNELRKLKQKSTNLYVGLNRFLEEDVAKILEDHLQQIKEGD